jgi:hypothetical protein
VTVNECWLGGYIRLLCGLEGYLNAAAALPFFCPTTNTIPFSSIAQQLQLRLNTMGNFHMQTPPPYPDNPETPYTSLLAPTLKKDRENDYLISPRLFKLSPEFSMVPSHDPFANDDVPTLIHHDRRRSFDLATEALRTSSPTITFDAASFFTGPRYNIHEPSTWPTLFLPYHNTPGASAPTHISEMMCHVHYKGVGARVLYFLINNEMNGAQTEEEKIMIELSAYMSWPFNCSRDGWRVYSGMTDYEERKWKEAVQEWQDEQDQRIEMQRIEDTMENVGLDKTLDEERTNWDLEKPMPLAWPGTEE